MIDGINKMNGRIFKISVYSEVIFYFY